MLNRLDKVLLEQPALVLRSEAAQNVVACDNASNGRTIATLSLMKNPTLKPAVTNVVVVFFASTPTHSLPSVIRPRGMTERMIFCFVSTVNNLKREARLERHVASYTGIVYFQLQQHPNFGRDGNRRRSPQVANGCWVPLNDFRRRPNCVTHTSHESRVTKDHPHMLRTHRTYSA